MSKTQRWTDNQQSSLTHHGGSQGSLPLSTAQAGMWLMQKLVAPNSSFNIAEAVEIHGAIDPALFETALRQVALEAETVRVRIQENAEGATQTIAPAYDGDIPFIDCSSETNPKFAAMRWMKNEFTRPVNLLTDPLWQCALFKLGPEHFIWYHRSHHIIMDGFSGGLIARRLATVYSALAENRPVPNDNAFAPLSALLEDETNYRSSARFERDRDYWVQRLTDRPKPVALNTRQAQNTDNLLLRLTSQNAATAGEVLRKTAYLPTDKVKQLRKFARASGVSMPQFMIAAICAYLYRITGMEDLIIGMPVTARSSAVVKRTPGMMANALPLRIVITPDMCVGELLSQVSKEVRQLLRHQCYRYEDLRHDLHLMMDHNQHLCSTVINIEPFDYDLRFGGHPVTLHNLSNASAENLAVFVYDRGEEQAITIDFDANPALYTSQELTEHQERLVNFIDNMAHDVDQIISHIDILTEAERKHLLVEWNATDADYNQQRCLHQLIEEQVRKTPEAPAVICGDAQLSYAQLNAKANQLAHYLRSLGVKPESRVAICLERSFEMVISLLAVLKAGGAYVPLDPSYPEDRLAFMLSDSAPQVLLTLGDLAKDFIASAPDLTMVDLSQDEHWASQADHNPDPVAEGLSARNLAYMIYTSGSTGKPKGAMNEHRAVVNRLLWKQSAYQLTPTDAVLQKTPFSFDVSVWEFFWPLMTGARLVMAKPEGHKDPAYLTEIIQKEHITTLHFVPSMLQVFLEHPQASACTNLRHVMCSGEALPESLARRFHQRLPGVKLHNLYGPTEAAVDVTAWTYIPEFSGTSIPLGKPIANTKMYVLDAHGDPTPVGVAGEIHIGGIQVGRGYWDRPELTAERFVPDPFGAPGSRLYRTGDLGRWLPDGTLEYLGRNDFQVKVRGFRIELGEIEARMSSHPEIREAVVVAKQSGAGDPRLVAYYTADAELTIQELRSYISQHLPDYMIPAAFVWLETLPLGPNGKLDRNALPDDKGLIRNRTIVAPRNEDEQQITEIWKTIFETDNLSIHDNFFELGGNSIQAVQMVSKIETELGKKLPLESLFKAQTIEQLAKLLSEESVADIWNPVVQIRSGGTGSPLFLFPGVGGQSHYLYQLAIILGDDHPIYTFQPKGLDGRSEPHTTIEEMADYYFDLLTQTQAEGPYYLAGHSLGGSVAFEIAKRLEAKGQQVGFVALLDSGILQGTKDSDTELTIKSLKTMAYIYGQEIDIKASDLEELTEEQQLQLMKPYLVSMGILQDGADLTMVRNLLDIFVKQMRIAYQPDDTPVSQLLFIEAEERVTDMERISIQRAFKQWKHLSRQPFVHALVPGNHLSMLDQQNAHHIASILQRWITLEETITNIGI